MRSRTVLGSPLSRAVRRCADVDAWPCLTDCSSHSRSSLAAWQGPSFHHCAWPSESVLDVELAATPSCASQRDVEPLLFLYRRRLGHCVAISTAVLDPVAPRNDALTPSVPGPREPARPRCAAAGSAAGTFTHRTQSRWAILPISIAYSHTFVKARP